MLFAVIAVAIGAAATDRFYIEDFVIAPGETRTVSILLNNEASYTAFQTDIYLPNGLSVEQEDGDYIFDLTTRKARDHNISSQLQVDGAIRVMSYSPSIKAYSGNSGALVTFNVVASEDFGGSASILMKNILFTTKSGSEVAFANEVCNVSVPAAELRGDVNGDGTVDISDVSGLIDYLLSDDDSSIHLDNADADLNGTVDIGDVTTLTHGRASHHKGWRRNRLEQV